MSVKGRYLAGLKKAIPVSIAYLAVSFTFGLAAKRSAFPMWFAALISATNLTSAGQFTGIELLRLGAGYLELSLAVFVINLRYALMSFSLSQQVTIRIKPATRFAMSLFLTDEVFALASEKRSAITPAYYFGLSTLPYLGWQLGTLAGYLSGGLFPKSGRFAWESEVLVLAARAGERIERIAIPVLYAARGESGSHISHVRDTLRFLALWVRLLFSRDRAPSADVRGGAS